MTHTPGPWRVSDIDNEVIANVSDDDTYDVIADCDVGLDREQAYENALLIAAAPDLLQACKLVNEWLMEPWSEQDVEGSAVHPAFRKALKSVRAALAKATTPSDAA